MIRASSFGRVLGAVRGARSVSCLAYTIQSEAMLRALETAAQRGAHVRVRLAGQPFDDPKGYLAHKNAAAVAELCRDGVDAQLVDPSSRGVGIHGKALVADSTLFLDDVNWTGSTKETILADTSPADAKTVGDAVDGRLGLPTRSLAIRKSDALAMEASVLRTARSSDCIEIETESFGRNNPVYSAMESAARRGARVRLLVSHYDLAGNPHERKAIAQLTKLGVQVRTCDDNAKFALVNAERGWIGSANATSSYFTPNQFDWGIRTNSHPIVAQSGAKFEERWQHRSHALR